MATLNIDGRDYDIDTLPEDARQQAANLHICDQEIVHLNIQLAIAQTARAAYARALQESLPKQ